MGKIRLLPRSSFRHGRWKNGGGETAEIATYPEGASLEDFVWRVSMARVEDSGAFSHFSGIDRTLSVLEGGGITLDFDSRGAVSLDRASAPYAFPADVAVSGFVSGIGITDLNVMTRRGAARHFVSRLTGADVRVIAPLGKTTILLAWRTGLAVSLGAAVHELAAGDALLLGEASGADEAQGSLVTLSPQEDAEVYVIDLWF